MPVAFPAKSHIAGFHHISGAVVVVCAFTFQYIIGLCVAVMLMISYLTSRLYYDLTEKSAACSSSRLNDGMAINDLSSPIASETSVSISVVIVGFCYIFVITLQTYG